VADAKRALTRFSWLVNRVCVRWQHKKKNINQMPVARSTDQISVSQPQFLTTSITKQELHEHDLVEAQLYLAVFEALNINDGTVFDCQQSSEIDKS